MGFVLLLLSFRVLFRVVMPAMISTSIDFRFVLTSVLFYVLLTLYEYSVCNNSNTKGGTCLAPEFAPCYLYFLSGVRVVVAVLPCLVPCCD